MTHRDFVPSLPPNLAATMPKTAVLLEGAALRELEDVIRRKGQPPFDPAVLAVKIDLSTPAHGIFHFIVGAALLAIPLSGARTQVSSSIYVLAALVLIIVVSGIDCLFRRWDIVFEPERLRFLRRGSFSTTFRSIEYRNIAYLKVDRKTVKGTTFLSTVIIRRDRLREQILPQSRDKDLNQWAADLIDHFRSSGTVAETDRAPAAIAPGRLFPKDMAASMPPDAVLLDDEALNTLEQEAKRREQPAFDPGSFALKVDMSRVEAGLTVIGAGLLLLFLYAVLSLDHPLQSFVMATIVLVCLVCGIGMLRKVWYIVVEPMRMRVVVRGPLFTYFETISYGSLSGIDLVAGKKRGMETYDTVARWRGGRTMNLVGHSEREFNAWLSALLERFRKNTPS